MKKVVMILLVILALAITLVFTCPDKQAHNDAIKDVIISAINDKLHEEIDDDVGIAMYGVQFCEEHASFFLESMTLTYNHYFVFSVARLSYEDQLNVSSFGLLNHIFAPAKEDFRSFLDEVYD